ncbi:FIG140336: TPR domain protein [hydrothermal vent metagenome]|uniref:FIG140336: TPR domain protein n=1 Tax=hydrothermal vent metagenome TaxID=652676 RepID=A0A3B1AWN2_9ZZZZ
MKNKRQILKRILSGVTPVLWVGMACFTVSFSAAFASNGTGDIKQIPDQPYGEYLAGLHAAIHNDLRVAADFHEKALVLDPDNRMILRKSFTIFIADGRYDSALKVAHKLTEFDISNSMIQMFLFLEQLEAGNHDAALLNLENMGNAGVYGLFKPLFQSWVLLSQGKSEEAEDVVKALLEQKGFDDFKKFHAGLLYDFIGKTQLAKKFYSESLVIPGALSLRTVESYGILLRRLGRDQDARQLYENYIEKAPDNVRLRRALYDLENDIEARSFITSEKDAVAEIFYTAANFLMQDDIRMPAITYLRFANFLKDDFYIADYLLGQIFEADKFYDGAMESYGKIPFEHALYFRAKLQMAWVLEKMDRLDEAIEAMSNLSRQFPKEREIIGSLGDINRMNSRFDAAEKAYSRYIEGISVTQERHWSIFYTRGIVREQVKKWDLAEADFLKALELRPDQPQVLNYLAYSWVDMGINIDKAKVMLERAVELRPYDGYIVDSLGWAMYRLGDMPKAVEYLEKAVLLQTDDWAINDHLGDAYWAIGRKNEAKFQWRHALSLKPDEDLIAKIKIKIRDGKK